MALLSVCAFLSISYLTGSLLLKKISFPGAAVLKILLGLDIITLLVFISAWSGILQTAIIKPVFYLAFLLSASYLTYKNFILTKNRIDKYSQISAPVFLMLLPGLFILGRSLSLPTSWDELTYQLAVPERWINAGRICFFQDNPYSGFPSFASVNFHLMLATGGIAAPRTLVLILWLLSMGTLYILLRPGLSKWTAGILTFSFGIGNAVMMSAGSAYADIFILVHFSAMLLISRHMIFKAPTVRGLIIFGVFAGAAASVKLTGIVLAASLIVLFYSRKKGVMEMTRRFSICIAAFAFTSFLFYLRPFLETGNPFYPYCQNLFSGNAISIEMSRYHHMIGSVKFGINGLVGFFTSPFLISFESSVFDGDYGLQFLVILSLAIATLILTIKSKTPWLKPFFALVLILYAFWFFSSQQARFLMPAVFLVFYLSKFSLKTIPLPQRNILLGGILILTVISAPYNIFKDCLLSWQNVFGTIKNEDYLYSSTGPGYLKAVDIINRKLPENTKLMLIFENRGFYIRRNYVLGTPFVQEKFFTPPDKLSSSADILETLRRNNISHLLIGLSENDPDRIAAYVDRSANFAKLLGLLIQDGKLKTIWQDEGFGVYEVK
ncbi:MAG: hypothetical protein A2X48_02935 [Lentisphaerae bacterium GWF2_49_21]|nr:MAG: hypothetical protein A2X48_02935 [Lentisphaerae bacterium GWF2_49_21]